jgi:glycosyltransferase involved in cell wall biosynthesis
MLGEQNTLHIYAFPLGTKNDRNPYFKFLYSKIIEQRPDIKIEQVVFFTLLFVSTKEKNIIHLHWATILYGSRFFIISILKLLINFSLLFIFKIRGIRIVWTMHNYVSHDFKYPLADKFGRYLIAKLADNIIVHTQEGKDYLINKFGHSKNIFIIPIGNYYGFYGEKIKERQEVRQKAGYRENDLIFFNFGLMKPYKGLEKLIKVFNDFSADNVLKLAVRGKFSSVSYFEKIKNFNKNPNVLIENKFLSSNDLLLNLCLADFSIFTFREILTSSAVILSLSYGLPVVAPRLGDPKEIIKDGENGFLFSSDDELKKIILKAKNLGWQEKEKLSQNSFDFAQKLDWRQIAQKTIKVYEL